MNGTKVLLTAAAAVILATTAPVTAQTMDPATCPMHAEHMAAKAAADGSAAHGADVDHRHDTLGVSHETTNHSFRLFDDGGAIELRANSAADSATIDAIRTHIRMIADQFSAGNFSTPMFVHDKVPDGITDMKRLQSQIAFRYEQLPAGARIRITTTDRDALAATHAFLRFQVIEHRTSNTGKVEADSK
jgi:hypothetical protein